MCALLRVTAEFACRWTTVIRTPTAVRTPRQMIDPPRTPGAHAGRPSSKRPLSGAAWGIAPRPMQNQMQLHVPVERLLVCAFPSVLIDFLRKGRNTLLIQYPMLQNENGVAGPHVEHHIFASQSLDADLHARRVLSLHLLQYRVQLDEFFVDNFLHGIFIMTTELSIKNQADHLSPDPLHVAFNSQS